MQDSLERFPEFKPAVKVVLDVIHQSINEEISKIEKTEMPYKYGFIRRSNKKTSTISLI